MSKLRVAKAIQKSFTVAGVVLKWVAVAILIAGLGTSLWGWAAAHFISFAIIIGIIVTFFLIGGISEAWDWSKKTIEEAKQEEREALERDRAEKRRQDRGDQWVHETPKTPKFPFEDYDDDLSYAHYR